MMAQPESGAVRFAPPDLRPIGYQEVVNFAFVEESWEADFAANGPRSIRLPTRLPARWRSCARPHRRAGGQPGPICGEAEPGPGFETGRSFRRVAEGGLVAGSPALAAGASRYGPLPEGWGAGCKVDFYDLKGDLEALLASRPAGAFRKADPSGAPSWTRSARIVLAGKEIGHLGELHPAVGPEIRTAAAPSSSKSSWKPLERQRFPPTRRSRVPAGNPRSGHRGRSEPGIGAGHPGRSQWAVCRPRQDVQLFDVYAGIGRSGKQKVLRSGSYARYSTHFARFGSRCCVAATDDLSGVEQDSLLTCGLTENKNDDADQS